MSPFGCPTGSRNSQLALGILALGILLDTENMEACLPHDKLQRICAQIATWLGRKKATKREILSLVGLL